jgi:hypothetical protein
MRLAQIAEMATAACALAGGCSKSRSRSTVIASVCATNGLWRPAAVHQLAIAWCFGRCRRASGTPRLDRRASPGRTVSEKLAIVSATPERASLADEVAK